MKMSDKSRAAIADSLKEALCRYITTGTGNTVVTDIHLQPNPESGELLIFNDDDEELSRVIVDEWVEYDSDTFYADVEPVLRSILTELKDKGLIDKLSLMKPFSFVLVDDEKETVAELLLIDDEDTLLLSDELLKGLDEELDDFLKKLLEENNVLIYTVPEEELCFFRFFYLFLNLWLWVNVLFFVGITSFRL